ncbi:hypothetical protein K7X08_014797 [Anisodus acutangulus]|uniref:Uncharacterized protein n=1 Tax=Anisodus acutangulus TaxID=402998 RepID=A0A9Q1R3G8_9SOLA|nr:hypothetical protein K7X08_014797 [Anisodus acutangulus]
MKKNLLKNEKNVDVHEEEKVVRLFLYPDDAEKSKKYIKDFVDYDDEVSDPNIDVLKKDFGDKRQFCVKVKFASSYGHEDQVEYKDLGGRGKEMCDHCGRGSSVIANKLTSIEDQLAAIRKLLETKSRRRSKCVSSSVRSSRKRIRKALQFAHATKTKLLCADASCKTLSLTDLVHVHNDDNPSSPLPDQVEDASFKTLPSSPFPVQVDYASFKTLPSEVVDSTVDSEDRSPDGRIIDVLAQIHSEDDIEEFGDAAQNGYEAANEEVV